MVTSNPLDFTVKVGKFQFSRFKGQAAGIRYFDEASKDDFLVLREIMSHREIKKWMDDSGKLTFSDYQFWAGKHNGESFLFAVHDARLISAKEIAKIRGFVSIYSERSEKFRVKRLVKNGVFDKSYLDCKVLEVSVAARLSENGQTNASGLMSSALRQACMQVRFLHKDLDQDKLKIMGFVDPVNVPSVRTLQACGFEKIAVSKYDSDSIDESDVYILNWDKLEEIINHTASKKVIFEPQKTDSHCGPAVTKALLNHLGVEVDQEQVVISAKAKSRLKVHGMRPVQIDMAVKKIAPNYTMWIKENSTWNDLYTLVNKYNLPVGVNWQGLFYDTVEEERVKSPNDDHGHYSVVVDVKKQGKYLIIDDPYSEYFHIPRIISYKWFEKRWWDVDIIGKEEFKTTKLLFVIVPKDFVFEVNLGMVKF